MSKQTNKTPAPKLTDEDIINYFCASVAAEGAAPAAPQLTLFVGNKMWGKRLYATQSAAAKAVTALAPKLAKRLISVTDKVTARKVARAIKDRPALRKAAVTAAFRRELLYAQPLERR